MTTRDRRLLCSTAVWTAVTLAGCILGDDDDDGMPVDPTQANIQQYIDNDNMLTRFGTMYATARWGKGVTAVEFQVGHRSVPNFTKRNEINFLDVPFTYYRVGIRKAMPGNADAQAAFDGYVKKAPAPKSTKSSKDGE